MIPAVALLLAGLAVRFAGAAARVADQQWALRSAGWFSCMIGIWLLASAAGAWSPLWVALALAAAGSAIEFKVKSTLLFIVADVAAVAIFAMVSVPPLSPATLLVVAAAAGVAGYVMDAAARVSHWRLRVGVFAAQCVGIVAVCAAFVKVAPSMPVFAWHTASPVAVLNIAIAPARDVQRVELDGGVVAWIDTPRTANPHAAAVLFHGAHRDGAHQPAAKVLRRALLDAGYFVLSVDHPGFGASPLPEEDHVQAWDPMPAIEAALRIAGELAGEQPVIAVGHSMGCLDVMRTLVHHSDSIDAAVLFGGAVNVPRPDDEAWASRFHEDRQIDQPLDLEDIAAIRELLYEAHSIAAELPDELPPILFVHFGIEHENVVIGREHLSAMFPVDVTYWDFDGATHYFNAWRRGGVLVGDRRIAGRLAMRLRQVRNDLESQMEDE